MKTAYQRIEYWKIARRPIRSASRPSVRLPTSEPASAALSTRPCSAPVQVPDPREDRRDEADQQDLHGDERPGGPVTTTPGRWKRVRPPPRRTSSTSPHGRRCNRRRWSSSLLVGFRLSGENLAESTKPHHATTRRRPPGAGRKAQRAAVGAGEGAFRRTRGPSPAATWTPGRRSRTRSAGISRQRSTSASSPTSSSSRRAASRSATRASGSSPRRTSASSRSASTPRCPRTRLAPGRPASAARLRPRGDHAAGPRAATGEALLHERRLRARAGDVHDLRAARHLRGRARPRCLGRRTSSACSSVAACSSRPASGGAGRAGGRPRAAVPLQLAELEVTDPFAVLRPPDAERGASRRPAQSVV